MKKLLSLPLLLLLTIANVNAREYAKPFSGTLDLDNLGQFFPNDSYIGLYCKERFKDKNLKSRHNHLLVVSLEEERGINLMELWFSPNENYTKSSIKKNDKWKDVIVTDFYINLLKTDFNINAKEYYVINRETLAKESFWQEGSCEIVSQEEIKAYAYEFER